MQLKLFNLFSGACSIELTTGRIRYGDIDYGVMKGVILTGGRPTRWNRYTDNRVVHYNINGFVSDLPNLGQGRMDHACSFYWRSEQRSVPSRRVSPDSPPFFVYEKNRP